MVFYTQPNFAGVPNQVDHGQYGIIASSSSLWLEQSVSVLQSDTMRAYIWSNVDTANPLKSYFGHVEDYVTRSHSNLKETYPSAQYSLQYLGLDSALAVPILVKMVGDFSRENTFAATTIVPYSTTSTTTLGVVRTTSAIGFIGNIAGSTTYVSLKFGIWDIFTGQVKWTSEGSLIAVYDGLQLSLIDQVGLPDDWVWGTPVRQANGSWLISLSAGAADNSIISTLVTNDNSIVDDGVEAATLTATVIDSVSGAVQPGETVYWSTTLGDLSGTSSVTNAAGQATIVLTADNVIGTATVTASLANQSSQSITISVTAVTDNSIISTLVTNNNSIVDDGVEAATLTATVIDSVSGAVQPGETVYWSTTLGDLSGTSSVTNAAGQATIALTADNVIGTATVTASLANQSSKTQTITITDASPAGSLLVMGARSSNRAYGEYIASRLVALDSTTLAPVTATWSYSGQAATATGSAFIDTQPGELLEVTASGYNTITLNVSNIIGTGGWYDEDDDPGSHGAFSARENGGAVVAWGQASRGGVAPASAENYDAQTLCATTSATSAIRSNHTVFAWGEDTGGAVVPGNIASRSDIIDLRSGRGTFVLRGTRSPYIQAWGRGVTSETDVVDLNVPGSIAGMNDIQIINMTEDAACVINTSGQVFAWGDSSCGGSVSAAISALTGVFACYASRRAFAVLYNSGQVAAWGDASYGGDARTLSGYSDIVRLCATESAFLALRSNGQIIAWGDTDKGATIPSAYLSYTDIVDIKSTYSAFAALRSNGQVLCWGDTRHGGDSSAVTALNDVVAITGTSWSFAALHSNGLVSAWGDQSYGGSTSAVSASLTNVRAIYPNTRAFVALKADNTFVAWGDSVSGGDQSMIPAALYGNISYEI